ncbi:MAG: hypothetical protein KGK01_09295 [Bradyrhizobium sp.]|uniref:hypothetical protein n=1 Tax=Bradyrhizobium sp. TaxID=376 RepID=UPI001C285E5D|nr:hypothetical protein [Bradyrhizobium sp.]MBU6462739.1 hypothetical protein [Pseudomonadota bacterium]MDE2067873.1 hypothetical protein [Bradyrhizobium sp.]MDE2242618.1 hypothetical protein [Bradyrhizobium sp.]MDE2470728.1 hypothetical protein [Bradyrhizobium sp.]
MPEFVAVPKASGPSQSGFGDFEFLELSLRENRLDVAMRYRVASVNAATLA